MSRLDGPHPGGYEHEGINAVNDSVRYRQLLPGVNWCSAGQFDCNRSRKQSAIFLKQFYFDWIDFKQHNIWSPAPSSTLFLSNILTYNMVILFLSDLSGSCTEI